jgi:hypothetical protein
MLNYNTTNGAMIKGLDKISNADFVRYLLGQYVKHLKQVFL